MNTPNTPISLTDAQLERYARHILLDAIDIEGQTRLLGSHALVIGCGGLGAAAIPYLAASGVGQLTLVDNDVIELSNLQRQVCYRSSDVGRFKAQVLSEVITQLNPDVRVHAVTKRVDAAWLQSVVPTVDVVLDCTDNFATRHAINRAAVASQKPLVSGAATRWEGQWMVFDTRVADSPCYACLFNESHDAVTDGACATLGIFSPLVGMVGAHQAALALGVLLNWAQLPLAKLHTIHAQTGVCDTYALARNPHCTVCGDTQSQES